MLATVADAQAERWDLNTELLASLIEVVDLGNRMFHAAYMEGSPPDPLHVPRPGESADDSPELEEPRTATAAEMRAFFGGAVEYTPLNGAAMAEADKPTPTSCDEEVSHGE